MDNLEIARCTTDIAGRRPALCVYGSHGATRLQDQVRRPTSARCFVCLSAHAFAVDIVIIGGGAYGLCAAFDTNTATVNIQRARPVLDHVRRDRA